MGIDVSAEFSDFLEAVGREGVLVAVGEMEAEGPRLLGLIDAGLQSGDMEEAAEAAHSLKSSSGALNLNASAELAQQVESAARSGDGANLAATAAALKDVFHRELAAVREFVEGQAADGAAE